MRKFAIQHEKEYKERVYDGEVFEEWTGSHENKCCKLYNRKVTKQNFSNTSFHGLVEELIGDLQDDSVVA